MNIERIKEELKDISIIYLETTTSTNDVAKSMEIQSPTLILAEEQTHGRGRMGRDWTSHRGKGIYATYVMKPEARSEGAGVISLLTAVAVARALEGRGLEARIKWPNDVLVHGKKIGGILCEGVVEGGEMKRVAIGIGLNVNFDRRDFPEGLRREPTSLGLELGEEVEREMVVIAVLRELEKVLGKFKEGNVEQEMDYIATHSYLQGKDISMKEGFRGSYVGIDAEGRLLIQTEAGVRRISSGEIEVIEEKERHHGPEEDESHVV